MPRFQYFKPIESDYTDDGDLETELNSAFATSMWSANFPITAAVCGFTTCLGRVIYSIGYCMNGQRGSIVGAIIFDLALVAVFVGAIVSLAYWKLDDKNFLSEKQFVLNMKVLPISNQKF